MRFYAVSTEAVELTFRALQKLDHERKGSHRPSRALRVATLFGHLQCRARGGINVQVGCRQLAEAWHLHPREIRADLQDLEAIGWLSYTSSTTGLCICLHEPDGRLEPSHEGADLEALNDSPVEPTPSRSVEPASAIAQPRVMAEVVSEPSAEPKRAPVQSPLIAQFAATYNQHKPGTWPAYTPTGTMLASRLRQAIRHAGSPEAFEAALIRALRGMPVFWRTEYPQERNGADCARALLQVDRASEGRGVEHWHVFCWGASDAAPYTGRPSGGIGGNTPGVGYTRPAATSVFHPEHRRACELLAWDGHQWTGRGMEAASLPASELQRLAEILEAAGFGKPGQAAEQFAQETQR